MTPAADLLTPPELAEVVEHSTGKALALMLYGSYARGTQQFDSDVDLLEIVAESPAPYSRGTVNVTQYTPAHLHEMAQRGSLFVLHLLTDGIFILDESGVLDRALRAYRQPASYQPVWNQLSVVAGAVNLAAPDVEQYQHGLCRLALYTLRTAVYLKSIESGTPCFDADLAAENLDIAGLAQALKMRRQSEFSFQDLEILARLLDRVLPAPIRRENRSTLSYAVANSASKDLAALFATVLGPGDIEYSALSVPPF
ncbi:nucleotidyltransferase domain-containing protein [Leifsonia sp. NPDC014704]|uniref:nucleotidyltransferase domain-containing protein n=1 Tax=Leifsonia sp. NPDC014704 TaxID=3364123 RepID=UPI0036F45120